MNQQELLKKLAKLETMNDQLTAELNELNRLAYALGFAEGLKTLKSAAMELLAADKKNRPKKKDE
jgi:hypothetical protein